MEKLEGAEKNEAKKILANEVTKICRGEESAISARRTAQETFVYGGLGQDLPTLIKSKSDLNSVLSGLEAAKEADFEPIRINTVVMKGINDTEIEFFSPFIIVNELEGGFVFQMVVNGSLKVKNLSRTISLVEDSTERKKDNKTVLDCEIQTMAMDIGADIPVTLDMLQENGKQLVRPILAQFYREAGPDLISQCLLNLT